MQNCNTSRCKKSCCKMQQLFILQMQNKNNLLSEGAWGRPESPQNRKKAAALGNSLLLLSLFAKCHSIFKAHRLTQQESLDNIAIILLELIVLLLLFNALGNYPAIEEMPH